MNRQKPDALQEERENMKALVLGITGDVARLISSQGLQKDLRVLELIIFGMFVVTKTYMTARRNSEKTNSQITGFHREMLDYATNEYFIKSPAMKDRKVLGPTDAAEVLSGVEKFHKEFLSRSELR